MRVDRRACLGNGAPSESAKQATASKAVQCNRWSDFMIQFFRRAGQGAGPAGGKANFFLLWLCFGGNNGADCRTT